MPKAPLFMLVACLSTATGWCASSRLQDHPAGIWSIAPGRGEQRWVVIHDLADGARSGIYHIEVIGRVAGAPAWKVRHLADHMAITEQALARSVIKPLSKGAVYPEAFESAYKAWQSENAGGGGTICQSTVVECLPSPLHN